MGVIDGGPDSAPGYAWPSWWRPYLSGWIFEHLRSTDAKLATTQDRLNWLNRLVACCDCNRPAVDTIIDAGFEINAVEHTSLPQGAPFVRPTVVGTATAPTRTTNLGGRQSRPATLHADPGTTR